MARMKKMSLFACALLALVCLTTAWARPTYVRPYGPDAPWNVPVAGLAKSPNSDTWSYRMYNFSPDRPGNFNLGFVGYTYPVYYVQDATTNYTVHGGNATINGKLVPWNPAWKIPPGSDAQVIVLDPATGREWDFWQVSISGTTISISNGSLVGSGEICCSGPAGDFRTKTNGWQPSRGCGIEYLAMLIRPEEISAGEIRHALSMPVANTDPTTHVAPATKTEGLSGPNTSKGALPEGARFALNITDAQIDAWVKTKSVAYQKLARVVAHALRDYGWFITDHGGAATLQFEATASADVLWRAQGIDPASDTARDLMDGLITQARIYALAPPPYTTSPIPPVGPVPCTAAETTACEAQYNACMAACNN